MLGVWPPQWSPVLKGREGAARRRGYWLHSNKDPQPVVLSNAAFLLPKRDLVFSAFNLSKLISRLIL